MAVNKFVYNGQVKLDLTGDTVTADKVASGKIFHLPNGNTATGTMLDYSSFPLYCISFQKYIITPSSDSTVLNLQKFDLGGRPVQLIIVTAIGTQFSSYRVTSTNSTAYIIDTLYLRSGDLMTSTLASRQTNTLTARPMHYSSYSAINFGFMTETTGACVLKNENLLASGGAYLEGTALFMAGGSYRVLIGG